MRRISAFALSLLASSLVFVAGCGGGSGSDQAFLSIGTAPTGGAFYVVGNALSEALNREEERNWVFNAQATKGSQDNIRRMVDGKLDFALSNAAITYYAVRGEEPWDKEYAVRSVMTLAPNVALFVSLESSNVKTIADLKGKRVYIGPGGAGFEMFVGPILEAHGLSYDDMEVVNDSQANGAAMLQDGSIDAAFLGGGTRPPAISSAASTSDLFFIPFEEEARQRLIEEYPFFADWTIPAETFNGQDEDYSGLVCGYMHLLTRAEMDEDRVYQVAKTLYERRESIAEKHPAGKAINRRNISRETGTEFHPGAVRFFEELAANDESESTEPNSESEVSQ